MQVSNAPSRTMTMENGLVHTFEEIQDVSLRTNMNIKRVYAWQGTLLQPRPPAHQNISGSSDFHRNVPSQGDLTRSDSTSSSNTLMNSTYSTRNTTPTSLLPTDSPSTVYFRTSSPLTTCSSSSRSPTKRGRPKGSKNKPKDRVTKPPKLRGRPPGSKNKPKFPEMIATQKDWGLDLTYSDINSTGAPNYTMNTHPPLSTIYPLANHHSATESNLPQVDMATIPIPISTCLSKPSPTTHLPVSVPLQTLAFRHEPLQTTYSLATKSLPIPTHHNEPIANHLLASNDPTTTTTTNSPQQANPSPPPGGDAVHLTFLDTNIQSPPPSLHTPPQATQYRSRLPTTDHPHSTIPQSNQQSTKHANPLPTTTSPRLGTRLTIQPTTTAQLLSTTNPRDPSFRLQNDLPSIQAKWEPLIPDATPLRRMNVYQELDVEGCGYGAWEMVPEEEEGWWN